MPQRHSRIFPSRNSITETQGEDEAWEAQSTPSYDSDPDVDPPSPRPSSSSRRKQSKRSSQYIPRPPNQFICFRSDWCKKNKDSAAVVRDHRQVSRLAGIEWKRLSAAQRETYAEKAEMAKQKHAEMYPQYHYKPSGRSSSSGKAKKRKANNDDSDDSDEWVPSSSKRRKVRRTSSATIKLPDSPVPPVLSLPTPAFIEDASTPELSLDSSSESPEPQPVLFTLSEEEDADDFVLTADIPPLDLYAVAPTKEKSPSIIACDSAHLPPALQYNKVSSQFFKADISTEARDTFLWCNEEHIADELDLACEPYLGQDVPEFNSEVQFTNPFSVPFDTEFDEMSNSLIGP
ncbi:hypothetical protein C8F01DRAFT_1077524 [Mycena amicta]|nr:hypothetical protein C8F01DRAFT_1077524 [Mycena amicta]